MGTTKKYWKGVEELNNTPAFQASAEKEFSQDVTVDEFLNEDATQEASTGRRDFLKFLGFSVAAATLAACEAPVTKVIPYVNKPENVTPGMPTWYASTYYDGNAYASILVKTREGRPILIKGNKEQGITQGSVNPQIVASVLSLYDSERLKAPSMMIGEANTGNWNKIDTEVEKQLAAARGKVTLVSSTVISPSTQEVINGFKTKYSADHIQYDAVSYAGIRKAAQATWGKNIIPNLDFSKAKTVVSISADFLNSWLLPTQFSSDFLSRRKPEGDWMAKHIQIETNMSLTGSNADVRGMIKPSEQASAAAAILAGIGGGSVSGVSTEVNEDAKAAVEAAITALKASKSESLVVAGSNDMGVQLIVNAINIKLGALNHTVNVNNEIKLFKSEDDKMNKLVQNVISGKGPKAIIFMDTNPVYSHSNGVAFGEALANVTTTISLSLYADETGSKCKIACPTNHALESWNDLNPTKSHYAIAQPSIRPLYDTRAAQESLMVWSSATTHPGRDSRLFYDFMKSNWQQYGFTSAEKEIYGDFNSFWSTAVHNSTSDAPVSAPTNSGAVPLSKVAGNISKSEGEIEIALYQKSAIGTGIHASNPWLQEMPDPMTKVTWDNYFTMSLADMDKGGYSHDINQEQKANMATVTVGDVALTLPVVAQPGQMPGTVGIAVGYGRGENGEAIGKAAYHTKAYGGYEEGKNGGKNAIGKNAYKFTTNGVEGLAGSIAKTADEYAIAMTQIHSTVMARHSVVRETTLGIFKAEEKEVYNPAHVLHTHEGAKPVADFDLWKKHPVEGVGHRWGMTIDLNSCIGCGTCMISCVSENNVPVVGKDEVRRGREMHWLRIDRYYASNEEAAVGQRKDADTFDYGKAERPTDNPSVVFMPMMCQHCNHAPCETVCPVAATTHSNEGLNMMTYNRCIGTRYCANNCPYKVRRFNWFNYPSYKKFTEVNPAQDDAGRMVLNPDVVVRTRGVMEKCSMCVQKIQAGKLEAKLDGRPVQDGDVTTACADSCPTDAIIMGDWNDTESAIRKSSEEDRSYQVLEEIGVKPNIWYKVKVRNNENALLDAIAEKDKEVIEYHRSHEKHGNAESHGAADAHHGTETKEH